MAAGNTNFTKLVTTTLQNLPSKVLDSLSTNNALLYMLQKRGNLKVVTGGRSFTHPIYYKQNSSYNSYGKLDSISTPLMDDITRAEYPIKIIAGSIVISILEEAMNSGNREKLINLVDETVTRAKISMSEVLGDQMFKDGTAANDFDGIPYLINGAPSGQTDVGGINPSTTGNTYWRNIVGSAVSAFNTGSEGTTAMNALLNNCTFGRQGPRLIVTTKTIYGLYEVGLTGNIRYVTTELADSGFRHLAYATMPIVFDDNCTASRLFMIDTDSLWLQVLSRGNIEITGMQNSINQLLKVALMYVFGNLTCGSRRTQGIVTVTG